MYIEGSQFIYFPNNILFLSPKMIIFLANSVDPDKMQRIAAFHLGLHCFLKHSFRRHKYKMDQSFIFQWVPDRPPDKSAKLKLFFLFFNQNICLIQTVLLSTQNTCLN